MTEEKKKSLVGNRYGRLVVLSLDESNKKGRTKWICVCDCGNKTSVYWANLTGGHTKSCGCLQKDRVRELFTTHGNGKHNDNSPEYRAWIAIKSRCYNPLSNGYENYGGRGIKMCDRWKDSFENFLADMGRRPSNKHSIDRHPNQNGDYEPFNCRWATDIEQVLNRRSTVWVVYNGERMCYADFKRKIGIKSQWPLKLIRDGWSADRIAEYYKNNKASVCHK